MFVIRRKFAVILTCLSCLNLFDSFSFFDERILVELKILTLNFAQFLL